MSSKSNDSLFPTLLASTVHDIKNSLGTLLGLVQQLSQKPALSQDPDLHQLEFEAGRINHSLMQLLVMYKIDSRNFSLAIDEYPVIDLINDAKAQQARLTKINHIEVVVDCDADLLGYCDYQNISNALGTILNNAQRYCRSKVLISAYQENEYLVVGIEDDGRGYPEHLLKADLSNPNALDWISGNTGLGLYFVSAIAKLHKSKDKHGFVRIDNQSRIGGARFRLFLP